MDKCEVCNLQIPLQEHHIHGRDIPNPNNPNNLIYCCANCHTRIHTGSIVIEGWFNTTAGRTLIHRSPDEPSITGREAKPHTY